MTDGLPPHDREAERSVLCAIMTDNAQFGPVAEIVSVGDFYSEQHRRLFGIMTALHGEGAPIDLVSVRRKAEEAGSLETVGGAAYIAGLLGSGYVSANARHHAQAIRERARLRSVQDAAARIIESAFSRNGARPGEGLQDVLSAIGDVTRLGDELAAGLAGRGDLVFADLSASPQPTPPALVGRAGQTLIAAGEKVAVVADSGSGKTHLLVPIALGIAAGCKVLGFDCAQQPVLYVSSDDDPDLVRKFQRHAAGLGLDLGALPLRVLDDPGFNIDEPGAVARVRKALADLGADKRPATFILESLTTNVVPQLTDLYDGVSVRAYIRRTLAALQSDFPGLTDLLSHHLKKSQAGGANDLSTRVSGSVQIRAGFRCVIGLVKSGEERFAVRTIKRSGSGARFDVFRVRIVGQPEDPLTLQDEGPVESSAAELQGAAGAVVAFLKAAGGPRPLTKIVEGVTGFKKRAVETACKILSEQDDPALVRLGNKPAVYALAPPKQTDLDLGGLD